MMRILEKTNLPILLKVNDLFIRPVILMVLMLAVLGGLILLMSFILSYMNFSIIKIVLILVEVLFVFVLVFLEMDAYRLVIDNIIVHEITNDGVERKVINIEPYSSIGEILMSCFFFLFNMLWISALIRAFILAISEFI